MRTLSLTLLGLFFAATAWAGTRAGTVTMNFDLSQQKGGEAVDLWIPYPVSDANQVISEVKYGGDFATAGVYTDRVYGTPMLHAHWDKEARSRILTFSFHVERQEVAQRNLPDREVPWDPSDFALYLRGSRLVRVDGKVKDLAEKITKGRKTVLEKAKAVYDWVCENTYRDPETRGCGKGDVCALLARPGGKCADISSVFVALARAAGVPARETFGIRLGKDPVTDITTWQHCWAEFYLPGTGWVSVDPADVRKMMLVKKLKLSDPQTVEYRKYFWGGIDAYRVKLSQGRDLTLAPAQKGDPVNYLMYPFAQVGGETIDWLDPAHFKYTITYRE
ncbi:MAG: transglutaminase-like domain-containing protein [Desulfuromonadales bacterium]|jgi:transglutaminase-like putative cysteine protease